MTPAFGDRCSEALKLVTKGKRFPCSFFLSSESFGLTRCNVPTLQPSKASHPHLHFRSHLRKVARTFIETALEILRNIRVEWIRCRIRRERTVTEMFVH